MANGSSMFVTTHNYINHGSSTVETIQNYELSFDHILWNINMKIYSSKFIKYNPPHPYDLLFYNSSFLPCQFISVLFLENPGLLESITAVIAVVLVISSVRSPSAACPFNAAAVQDQLFISYILLLLTFGNAVDCILYL